MKYHTNIDVDGTEIPVVIEYEYSPPTRGARDSLGGVKGAGPPLEPDEPESVEIETIRDARGGEVEVSDEDRDKLADEILKSLAAERSPDEP